MESRYSLLSQPHVRLIASLLPLPPTSGRHISEMLFEAHCAASGYVSKGEIYPSETDTPSDPDEGRICCAKKGLTARDFPCAFYYAGADCGDKLHISYLSFLKFHIPSLFFLGRENDVMLYYWCKQYHLIRRC